MSERPFSQDLNGYSQLIPSGDPINNNANGPTISRKVRSRATKAEMKAMTVEQRTERKKKQNRQNSRKCVQKKNKEITDFEAKNIQLKKDIKQVDMIYDRGRILLLEVYKDKIRPRFHSNPPYGNPYEFDARLSDETNAVSYQIKQRNAPELKELEDKYKSAEQKCNEVEEQTTSKTIVKGTLAGQKCRAKKTLTKAHHEYYSEYLQTCVDEKSAMINVLNKYICDFNSYYLGCEPLEELVVLNNNEPSSRLSHGRARPAAALRHFIS
uniref:BZIP domain-containing protein n=1 Tax=Caenorhabditis japonica TaxID=281687 RepID=A0A8R1ICA3_CAEJA